MDFVLFTHVLPNLFRLWRTVLLYCNQSGHQVDVIYLDLLGRQKVFDRVPHARLIYLKLGHMELIVNCYNGLKTFFYPMEDREYV